MPLDDWINQNFNFNAPVKYLEMLKDNALWIAKQGKYPVSLMGVAFTREKGYFLYLLIIHKGYFPSKDTGVARTDNTRSHT